MSLSAKRATKLAERFVRQSKAPSRAVRRRVMGDVVRTTPLDLPGILAQHAGYHARLNEGDYESNPAAFDDAISSEHLGPIAAAIGVKGVGDLLHVSHELVIEVLHRAADKIASGEELSQQEEEALLYVQQQFNRVMEWGFLAAMQGAV
jgi:hypothetical protein